MSWRRFAACAFKRCCLLPEKSSRHFDVHQEVTAGGALACNAVPSKGGSRQKRATPTNVGTGQDVSIAALAYLVSDLVGYQGRIVFDTSRPDGTPRSLLEVSKLHALGWRASTPLREGLRRTHAAFLASLAADSTPLILTIRDSGVVS